MGASVGGVVPTLTDDNPQTPPCGSGAVPSPCSGGRRGRGEHDSKQQSREVLTAGVAGLAWLSRPWVAVMTNPLAQHMSWVGTSLDTLDMLYNQFHPLSTAPALCLRTPRLSVVGDLPKALWQVRAVSDGTPTSLSFTVIDVLSGSSGGRIAPCVAGTNASISKDPNWGVW